MVLFSTHRLARWAVRCVSDCRWDGNAGREGWAWDGCEPPVKELSAIVTRKLELASKFADVLRSERVGQGDMKFRV